MLLHLMRQFRRVRKRRSIGLLTVLCLLAISILGNALCFIAFESGPDQQVGLGDGLWYSVVSITTIGYGDYYPTTFGGRLCSFVFVVIMGLGTFTVFLGMAIDWITDFSLRERRGMSSIIAKDHILIVNFPSVSRVSQLIEELQSDPQHAEREIVIVTDQIQELPFDNHRVLFINGPMLEQATYLRAKAEHCRMAIVLATSYGDSNSDAVVASIVAVINSIEPDIHIVAECLNERHRLLFSSVNCDAIVFSMTISGNLLVQEAQDPGVTQLVDTITSNVRGTTLFTTEVDKNDGNMSYNDLAKQLLDRDINLICVCRREESFTSFVALFPDLGDRAIYAANRRYTWPELLANG